MTGRDDIPGTFRFQAGIARDLGSPFVARLCDLFAERLGTSGAVAARLAEWPSHESIAKLAVPLRVVGALHALVLEGRQRGARRRVSAERRRAVGRSALACGADVVGGACRFHLGAFGERAADQRSPPRGRLAPGILEHRGADASPYGSVGSRRERGTQSVVGSLRLSNREPRAGATRRRGSSLRPNGRDQRRRQRRSA